MASNVYHLRRSGYRIGVEWCSPRRRLADPAGTNPNYRAQRESWRFSGEQRTTDHLLVYGIEARRKRQRTR